MLEQNLKPYMKNRPAQLRKEREKGTKIVGYFPGNYVPEELIYASGAIPIGLINSGNSEILEQSLSAMPHIFCPFARTQVGERLAKKDPFYNMLDMLVAPITCQHLRKAADIWEYYGDIEIFKLGVPHQYTEDSAIKYYTERLGILKERLQKLTGNEITADKISNAIKLYNRIREGLREISLLRRFTPLEISALDFIKLNHISYYADPVFMADMIESVHEELMANKLSAKAEKPRILLVGPNIGYGDYQILDSVKDAGGEIVIEEICEGIRYYWQTIDNSGDALDSLAKGYLKDRLPCAFIRNSTQKRLDFTLELIKDFNISGVIWYELHRCETYDSESYFFAQKLEELNIPTLIIESDYGVDLNNQIKMRTEAFIELLKGE
jgi:benzoyl-CoA reductase/2-hydroxyglutaryl-CoA dehydratase subunit BcrC/BadD/HgdB